MKRIKPRHSQAAMYLMMLAAAVAAMVSLRKCDNGMQLEAMQPGMSGNDTIDVGIIYGPLSYYIYNDTLGGVNYDLLRQYAKDTGRYLKFWPVVGISEALERLEKGNFDIIASLPLDNSLRERFPTTESIYFDRLVLLQVENEKGETEINSALELGNDTVFIAKGSSASGRMANLSDETGIPIPICEKGGLSEEYLCMKVASGEIKLAVVNEKTAREMKRKYPKLSFNNPVSFTQFQVWAVNPNDSALSMSLNIWLDSISSTENHRMLLDRYFSDTSIENETTATQPSR